MHRTEQILKILYVIIIREYVYRHVMKYLLRPALRIPRAVDVPSALSIDRGYRCDYIPGVTRKSCRSAKHSFSRAPHGNLHVNRFGICVTDPSPIWSLI
jgi:hypothetical protein